MILSEHDRRWAEIRLYQFCTDVYQIRQKSMDIIDVVNLICDIYDIDAEKLKPIIRVMLSDTYYQSTKREIILLGTAMKIPANQIGSYLGMSRQGVAQYIERNKELFMPMPRCNIEDDHLIIDFMKAADDFKKIGKIGNGTTN